MEKPTIRNPRIKHVLGEFKSRIEYPTIEDFEYYILNWYCIDGGYSFIHEYRGIKDIGKPIFDNKILLELLDNDSEKYQQLIGILIDEGIIEEIKKTAHTTYYSINHTKYYKVNLQ